VYISAQMVIGMMLENVKYVILLLIVILVLILTLVVLVNQITIYLMDNVKLLAQMVLIQPDMFVKPVLKPTIV